VVAAPADRDRAGVTPDHDDDQEHADRPRRTPLAAAVVWVLAGLVVAGGGVAAAGWWVAQDPGKALTRVEQRGDVARVAEQFTVRVNNYDSESVDAYERSVASLLTTKFKAEFDQAMDDIVVQVEEAQMESQGEVLASGVAALDDDSARVLVAADATVKTVFDERQRHFRWEVSLVQVDGRWLVDDFTPVA
jgi:Mce-associated membrane protein